MNEKISADDKLEKFFQIGHSYFMHKDLDDTRSDIWTYEVTPMLEEYFFEDRDELIVFQKMYEDTFRPT
jgi:hypothetical protein